MSGYMFVYCFPLCLYYEYGSGPWSWQNTSMVSLTILLFLCSLYASATSGTPTLSHDVHFLRVLRSVIADHGHTFLPVPPGFAAITATGSLACKLPDGATWTASVVVDVGLLRFLAACRGYGNKRRIQLICVNDEITFAISMITITRVPWTTTVRCNSLNDHIIIYAVHISCKTYERKDCRPWLQSLPLQPLSHLHRYPPLRRGRHWPCTHWWIAQLSFSAKVKPWLSYRSASFPWTILYSQEILDK